VTQVEERTRGTLVAPSPIRRSINRGNVARSRVMASHAPYEQNSFVIAATPI
jgi:hypothetical protein